MFEVYSMLNRYIYRIIADTFNHAGQPVRVTRPPHNMFSVLVNHFILKDSVMFAAFPYRISLQSNGNLCSARDVCAVVQDVEESELRGDENCAVPCQLSRSDTLGEPLLTGPCGCIGPKGNCNEEFAQGIVKDLCTRMGNNPVTAHPQIGIEQRSNGDTKLPAKQRLLQFRAGAE